MISVVESRLKLNIKFVCIQPNPCQPWRCQIVCPFRCPLDAQRTSRSTFEVSRESFCYLQASYRVVRSVSHHTFRFERGLVPHLTHLVAVQPVSDSLGLDGCTCPGTFSQHFLLSSSPPFFQVSLLIFLVPTRLFQHRANVTLVNLKMPSTVVH